MELNRLNLLKGKKAFAHSQQSAQLQISQQHNKKQEWLDSRLETSDQHRNKIQSGLRGRVSITWNKISKYVTDNSYILVDEESLAIFQEHFC